MNKEKKNPAMRKEENHRKGREKFQVKRADLATNPFTY
jgi:hypothetical protein